jgi:hypothetical protein
MACKRTSRDNATRRIFSLPVAIVALLSGLVGIASFAQGLGVASATAKPASATPAKNGKRADTKPTWNELNPAQQHALMPLAGEWNKLESSRKEKWLVIGNKFASMSPTEQERMQERMREWIKLTPAQRRSVRESYARAKKLDAEKKSAQWQQYQQLSEEQKKKLAQVKPPKHVAALPPTKGKAPAAIQLPAEALEQAPAAPAMAAPAMAVPAPASTPSAPPETK